MESDAIQKADATSADRDLPTRNSLPRVHVVGRKNSGKTTLIVDLVRELTNRGLQVGTIKHTHHHNDLDTPGKDSFHHRQAGSSAVGIIAPAMDAVFFPRDPNQETTSRFDAISELLGDCDLVLVEGGLRASALKIEVWRSAGGEPPLAIEDQSIRAVVTDDELPKRLTTPSWSRTDVGHLAGRVLEFARSAPNAD